MSPKTVCLLVFLALVFITSHSKLIILKPQPVPSLTINLNQNESDCYYLVTITTSCSSPEHTGAQVSIAFGDSNGTQVYAPKLQNNSTTAFQRCSTDTFTVTGPCLSEVCYLYLYKSGFAPFSGWEPETVQVNGLSSGSVTFYYGDQLPNDVWEGFNYCSSEPSSARALNYWFAPVFQLLIYIGCFKFLAGSI